MTETDFLSLEDAAVLAGVSVATITRWRREGKLPAYRRGRRAVVRRADLERLVVPVIRAEANEPSTAG